MDFQRIFEPKSMAVVGVSLLNDRHPANVVFNKNHLRYPLDVYGVNPKGGSLLGEKVFSKVSDIGRKVDLVVIAVRAEQVPETLQDCIRAGAGGAAVISGGFAESGRSDLQDQIVAIAREAGFPLIGPNCLGIFSPGFVDTFFLPTERLVQPLPGNVALISQSGGILVDQMINFAHEGIGLSLGVSIGNKAFVKEVDLLRHLANDPKTEVIAFYLEGFGKGEGREFVLAARECHKPIVVMKAGKSEEGVHAVTSHTASLAGNYGVFSKVLSQYGVVEARTPFQMVSFCESLGCYHRSIGGRIGIVTGSGGHGALAVDFCMSHGLKVPSLHQGTREEIQNAVSASVRAIASLGNPIDLTGSAVDEDFVMASEILSRSEQIDCVLLLLLPYMPGVTSDLGARLSHVYRRFGKPLVAYVPHVEKYGMLIEGFQLNQVPVSPAIEGAVLMAEAMTRVGGG